MPVNKDDVRGVRTSGKLYQLEEDAVTTLSELVQGAHNEISTIHQATSKEIADLYTSRDQTARSRFISSIPDGGISIMEVPDPLLTSDFRAPQTTANLFLSRLRSVVTSLVPGTPTLEVKARTPGASYTAEHQNELTEWAADHGNLSKAMRRAAFLGMVSPYFGLKFIPNNKAKYAYNKALFIALEPYECGYEPFASRFIYHSYDRDFGSLPPTWREAVKEGEYKDWDRVKVTEVYHEGFLYGGAKGPCPMSIFIDPTSSNKASRSDFHIGNYIGTTTLPCCPVVIRSFLDPAPGEDVAPAECLSWIPLMHMIVDLLGQIDREIKTINNINLYDKMAIRQEIIREIVEAPPGTRLFVGVDVDDAQRGVNATMRPVEMNATLPQYLQCLNTYIALFDDVTGVSAMERGSPMNPEKSATEAAAITQNASRRNKDRLEVISDAWSEIARVHHYFQRQLYGKTVDIPTGTGLVHTVQVPDPNVALFAFRVDPVDLEHISRKGEIESTLTFLQQATQTMANFRGSTPKIIREALRRAGKAMGITDIDLLMEAPKVELGPEDRLIRHFLTGADLPVMPQDDHKLYLSYYQNLVLQGLEGSYMPSSAIVTIGEAIEKHQAEVQKAEMEQQQMLQQGTTQAAPGIGPLADQISAPAVAAGQVPLLGPR